MFYNFVLHTLDFFLRIDQPCAFLARLLSDNLLMVAPVTGSTDTDTLVECIQMTIEQGVSSIPQLL